MVGFALCSKILSRRLPKPDRNAGQSWPSLPLVLSLSVGRQGETINGRDCSTGTSPFSKSAATDDLQSRSKYHPFARTLKQVHRVERSVVNGVDKTGGRKVRYRCPASRDAYRRGPVTAAACGKGRGPTCTNFERRDEQDQPVCLYAAKDLERPWYGHGRIFRTGTKPPQRSLLFRG